MAPSSLSIRFGFGCMPVGCSLTAAGLAEAARELGVAHYRVKDRGDRVEVDLDGPSVERFRSAVSNAACVEVHRVVDEVDPLVAVDAATAPEGIAMGEETVPLGPERSITHRHAVTRAESPAAAATALNAFLGTVRVPAGTRFMVETFADHPDGPMARSYLVEDRPLVSCRHIADAQPRKSLDGAVVVQLTFDADGGRLFGEATAANVKRRLALVLGDAVQSAPVVMEPIRNGRCQLSLGHRSPPGEAESVSTRVRVGRFVSGVPLLTEDVVR